MNFVNTHPELIGKHALFGASKYAWLGYDDNEIASAYVNSYAATIGTLVHEYAKRRISRRMKIENDRGERNALLLYLLENKIPANVIDLEGIFCTLMPYVNDAIGYKMSPEVLLYYSDNVFGWADTVNYSRRLLRIHDLKSGNGKVKMDQLMIYAGLFYLQFKREANLQKSKTELRIYQNQGITVCTPTNQEIAAIMDKIIHADVVVDKYMMEG